MTKADDLEARIAATATAPRVTPNDLKANIASVHYFTAGDAIVLCGDSDHAPPSTDLLTICILVCKNGFTIVGKSACASPENFNAELGRKIAYDDATNQLWPLMGYALRDRLAAGDL